MVDKWSAITLCGITNQCEIVDICKYFVNKFVQK